MIHALQKWRTLLLGMKINVMSDHHSLTYLMKQRSLSRRQAQWLEVLADFNLNFHYIAGEDNSVADALSRKGLLDDDKPSVEIGTVAALVEVNARLSEPV